MLSPLGSTRSSAAAGAARVARRALALALCSLLLLPTAAPAEPASDRAPREVSGAGAERESASRTAERRHLGTWRVERTGPARWLVSWRSPERLPVVSDRPTVTATAPALAGPSVTTPDGRTVRAVVRSAARPRPSGLGVRLSGRRLDAPDDDVDVAARGVADWTPPLLEPLATDPGAAGPLATRSSDYALPPLEIPGMREPVEVVGHVVEPETAGADRPLVVLLHGRHAWCYDARADDFTYDWPCRRGSTRVPSHLGYDYLQQRLASQGFVTVSLSADGINAQDGPLPDAGAAGRSLLVRHHLDRWVEWAARGRPVDLDRVVLVGHSRGGEGVARASLETPLDAGYRIAGQILLAPTDFARQTTPFVPTVTLLPSCDGDVSDLQGQLYTDASRGLDPADTSWKSSVLMVGANHNAFNTEWTPGLSSTPAFDDAGWDGGVCAPGAPTRLSPRVQRRLATSYVAGAVRLFARDDDTAAALYDGSRVRPAGAPDGMALSHLLGGGRDVRIPGSDADLAPAVGAATQLCRGTTPWRPSPRQCGRTAGTSLDTPHWPAADLAVPTASAFEMTWDDEGASGGLALADPLALAPDGWLSLRTVVDPSLGDARLRVRVTDADGRTAVSDPVGGTRLPALPHGPRWYAGKLWAQEVRVAADALGGVDTGRLTTVELLGGAGGGRVWVLDVAAGSGSRPAVPQQRAAVVDLGEVTVDEGPDGQQTAQVPFTVTGTVRAPSRFSVFSSDGSTRRVDVSVPPGTTSGVVPWTYPGNDLHSRRRTRWHLSAYAVSGVMVRHEQGRVVVVDDDPAPRLRLVRDARSVAEGDRAVWRARLSEPVDYDLLARFSVVRGDSSRPPVRADDIARRWLRRWAWVEPGSNPLMHRARIRIYRYLPAGRTRLTLSVPTADDRRREPAESLAVRVAADGLRDGPVTILLRRGR